MKAKVIKNKHLNYWVEKNEIKLVKEKENGMKLKLTKAT